MEIFLNPRWIYIGLIIIYVAGNYSCSSNREEHLKNEMEDVLEACVIELPEGVETDFFSMSYVLVDSLFFDISICHKIIEPCQKQLLGCKYQCETKGEFMLQYDWSNEKVISLTKSCGNFCVENHYYSVDENGQLRMPYIAQNILAQDTVENIILELTVSQDTIVVVDVVDKVVLAKTDLKDLIGAIDVSENFNLIELKKGTAVLNYESKEGGIKQVKLNWK